MIPFVLSPAQFAQKFHHALDKYSSDLINIFRQIVDNPFLSAEVVSADIEVFVQYESELYISAILNYWDINTNLRAQEIDLVGKDFYKKNQFHPNYFTDEFGGLGIISDILKSWIAECWWKAGGWDYPIYAFVFTHEDMGNGETIVLTHART